MGINIGNWPDLSFEANAGDRRAYPRFRIGIVGVCSIEGSGDVGCWTRDLSLGGVFLHCEAMAATGDRFIVSLPQMGLLRGRVVRTSDGGFAAAFDDGHRQRSRIASYLVWLVNRTENPSMEDRGYERIVPFHRIVAVSRVDGTATVARILDVSRSGIAFTTTSTFAVGEPIRIGDRAAAVIRLVEGGVAARFDEELTEGFDATIRF